MRSLLALLIGLALAMSPALFAMAVPACGASSSPAMAGIDAPGMAGMPVTAVNKAGTHPCGDHAGKSGKNCAQACAAICCVAILLPSMAASPRLFVQRTAASRALVIARRSFDPAGLDPPPKSIA